MKRPHSFRLYRLSLARPPPAGLSSAFSSHSVLREMRPVPQQGDTGRNSGLAAGRRVRIRKPFSRQAHSSDL
jgi:hypothetical protein